ncbi:hypothetical protein OROHE_016331 [Orobanche hederae]
MARALRFVPPPVIRTPTFRHMRQLPQTVYSPFSRGKFKATPLPWKLHSVSRLNRIRASAESRQANGDGEDRLPQLSSANWTEPLANFAANNFLPLGMVERTMTYSLPEHTFQLDIGSWCRSLPTHMAVWSLVSGVLLGLANPTLGWLADTYYLSKLSTFGIFIISGLTLHSNEISAAAEAWPIGIFGLASILYHSLILKNHFAA